MHRIVALLAMAFIAMIMLVGCGPDAGTSSSEALTDVSDGSVPSEIAEDDSLAERAERDSADDTGRRCGWLCCSQQHTACGRRNAGIDSDYIMEPCDLFYEICVDGLPD